MSKNLVSWKERISYALGDTGSNLIFQMTTLYLMIFYTDVYGISAAVVGTLFLVARCVDAVIDPIVGIAIDKTNTKWGKCRPYFLWFAIPFGVIAVLAFTTPNFSMTGKIVYAFVTYIALNIIYSIINLPISAILPSLTDDPQERTVVNTVRMVFAMIGMMVVSIGTLPLVKNLGKGNDQKGYLYTMIIFATIGTIFFLITFANTRERIKGDNEVVEFKDSVKAIKGNVPWFIILLLGFTMWIGMTMKNQTTTYFFKYNLNKPELVPVVMGISILCLLPAMAMAPIFTKRIGKKNTYQIGNIITIIGLVIMLFGTKSIPILIVGVIISSLGQGFGAGLVFAMMADTVDYGEWKSGVRAQGLLYAAASFGSKLGMGIGGAICAWILAAGKYVPNAEQVPSALRAIEVNYITVPLIFTIIGAILLHFYKLDKEYDVMAKDLSKKRAKFTQNV